MTSETVQRWAYVTSPVPRVFVEDLPAKAAFERAERLNAASRAVTEGFVPVPGAPVAVAWEPLSDIDLEMMCRIDRDLDGQPSDPAWREATEDEIRAEEARRRENLRGSQVMRVAFDVYAPAEEPHLLSLGRDAHAVLAAEGAQVLADKDNSILLCGGALRRHKFAPRDAAWLRDGAIDGARCQDCDVRVTRRELLERRFREDQNGTCETCGDALEQGPSGHRLDVYCPNCRVMGRE